MLAPHHALPQAVDIEWLSLRSTLNNRPQYRLVH